MSDATAATPVDYFDPQLVVVEPIGSVSSTASDDAMARQSTNSVLVNIVLPSAGVLILTLAVWVAYLVWGAINANTATVNDLSGVVGQMRVDIVKEIGTVRTELATTNGKLDTTNAKLDQVITELQR